VTDGVSHHHTLSLTPQDHIITFFPFSPSSPFPTETTTIAPPPSTAPRHPTPSPSPLWFLVEVQAPNTKMHIIIKST